MKSTVGDLAPICLRNKLLNIWTTSFFAYNVNDSWIKYKEQQLHYTVITILIVETMKEKTNPFSLSKCCDYDSASLHDCSKIIYDYGDCCEILFQFLNEINEIQ